MNAPELQAIATIYQSPDGNVQIVSNVVEPIDLARVLAALIPTLLVQAKEKAARAVVDSESESPDAPVLAGEWNRPDDPRASLSGPTGEPAA